MRLPNQVLFKSNCIFSIVRINLHLFCIKWVYGVA